MTAVADGATLLDALKTTPSATATLAAHLRVPELLLTDVHAVPHHLLTERERKALDPHPGVVNGYYREAVLRTPAPGSRSVAWVKATVLTSALPRDVAARVVEAREPLGGLLIAVGAVRESLGAWRDLREDFSGELIGLVSEAVFRLAGTPVAYVREEVYEWVVR